MRTRSRATGAIAMLVAAAPGVAADPEAPLVMDPVSVIGTPVYRASDPQPAPVLLYGLDYFQRFEPISVGDMLRRLPGMVFVSDIGEYDAPQFRGIEAGYTQVLIDGRRFPGSAEDRSVLVDRIPAELVERIEVQRSPTAELDGQGVAGTINIVLKDGAALPGPSWRLSGIAYEADHALAGAGSLLAGAAAGAGRVLFSADLQQQRTPKSKHERFASPDGELDSELTAEDTRRTEDRTLGVVADYPAGAAAVTTRISVVDTLVEERERQRITDAEGETQGRREHEDVRQRLALFDTRVERPTAGGGYLAFGLAGSRLRDEGAVVEAVEEALLPDLRQRTDIDDRQLALDAAWHRESSAHRLSLGMELLREQRDAFQSILEREDEEIEDTTPANARYAVEERRADLWLSGTRALGSRAALTWGVRLEDTDLDLRGTAGRWRRSFTEINPSLHWRLGVGERGVFRASVARTLRRPSFDDLVPFIDRDAPGEDQVTVGNPALDPEISLGLDLGYEVALDDGRGVFGLSLFHRDIDDKIELAAIAEDTFTPANVGQGWVRGLELDLGASLSFAGWPDVLVHATAAWLDSEVDDAFTGLQRRFNRQPDTVATLDLTHLLPRWRASWGVSYRKQGAATDYLADEIARIAYDANLEVFVEKALGRDRVLRLTLNNLLDAKKTENGRLFETPRSRAEDAPELLSRETEETGRVLLLTLRGRF